MSDNSIPNTELGLVERSARWLGGLDHPHYDDERNRYVWYEASAVAYQGLLVAIPTVAAAVVWVARTPEAVWYTLPFIMINTVLGLFVQGYVGSRRADCTPRIADYLRGPAPITLLAFVVYILGSVHVVFTDPRMKSALYVGVLLAGVGVVIGLWQDARASSTE